MQRASRTLRGLRRRPIELRSKVVDPGLVHPTHRIAVERRVRVEPGDPRWSPRSIDPDRAHTEARARTRLQHELGRLAHELTSDPRSRSCATATLLSAVK